MWHIARFFDEVHVVTALAHGAFDFGVALVADHNDLAPLGAMAGNFEVYLGDQRTGGIENAQAAPRRFGGDCFGNTVGAEDDNGAVGHLIEFIDKYRALGAQVFDDVFVVHNFMANVDGRAEGCQRALDDGDGAFDAGAEAARVGEQDVYASIPTISTSKRTRWPASG
jgi:hypothetical protein